MEHIQAAIAQHPILAPALGGILAHLVSHQTQPASLTAFASVVLGIPTVLTVISQPASPILFFLETTATYLLTLGASITAYRLSPFHPLAKYPGPVLARVSRLWAAQGVIRGYQHLESHELFTRYGDVVRTGPNHLIMRNASAIPVIHGVKDRWPRHARAQVVTPYHAKGNVISVIDPAEHSKRRRIWDRAFTAGAVKSYEPMLQRRLDELIQAFAVRSDTPIDIAEWFGLFSIDFMGDFAFGGMFDMMKHGEDTKGLHKGITESLRMIEIFGTIPWVRSIVQILPKTKAKEMQSMGLGVADQRKKQGSQSRDLFYYLLEEDKEGGQTTTEMSPMDMGLEALLAMGAGSDTTSTALANTIYYLISYPAVFARLRAELDAVAGEEGASYDAPLDSDHLAELKYLQAVINETLRLQPAVPNGVQRTAHGDHGPLPVAGYVIPAGTSVQIPTWSIHRDVRYFSPQPESFWPERWLPEEGSKIAEAQGQDFKLSQGAYMPFHYGPANCVGRSLALHELRTVLSALVRRFDFSFAPGFEGSDWIGQLKDQFILLRGELKVVMTERK